MTSFKPPASDLRFQDYLNGRDRDPYPRYEFVTGKLFELPVESDRHWVICGTISDLISDHLGQDWEAFGIDVPLRIDTNVGEFGYLPDAVICCREVSNEPAYITAPLVIIEVTSPASQRIDRGEKRLNCTRVSSLEEYVLVAEDEPRVDVMRRSTSWSIDELYPGDTLSLESVGLTLPLRDIYRTISFQPTGPANT